MWFETMQSGGGSESGGIFSKFVTYTSQTSATDSSPLIIRGTFRDGDKLVYKGIYYSTEADASLEGEIDVTLGDTYIISTGRRFVDSGYFGMRKVTVYSDRIEIGSGGYGDGNSFNDIDSFYGCFNYLYVGNGYSES